MESPIPSFLHWIAQLLSYTVPTSPHGVISTLFNSGINTLNGGSRCPGSQHQQPVLSRYHRCKELTYLISTSRIHAAVSMTMCASDY